MKIKIFWVVQDHFQVLRALHVVHAPARVIAHMRYLLLSHRRELGLSPGEIVGVEFHLLIFGQDVEVNSGTSCHLMLSVLLSQLKNDFGLGHRIFVVWEDQHELVVMGDVEVLIERFLAIEVKFCHYALFLDQELRVLMNQEGSEVLHFPLSLVDAGCDVQIDQHLLQLFVLRDSSSSARHWEIEHGAVAFDSRLLLCDIASNPSVNLSVLVCDKLWVHVLELVSSEERLDLCDLNLLGLVELFERSVFKLVG
jgi:hypothetical protein